MPDLDSLRELTGEFRPPPFVDLVAVATKRRRRSAVAASAAAAAVVVAVGGLAVTRGDSGRIPEPAPSPTPTQTPIPTPVPTAGPVPRGPSDVTSVRVTGRCQCVLEVAGETVPGNWTLEMSRGDVWVASRNEDDLSATLWWGKGTAVRAMDAICCTGGIVISPDARWITWTRDVDGQRVMEVVDTATGKARWNRDDDDYDPELDQLLGTPVLTNDGVVAFVRCTEPLPDSAGSTDRCDAARVEVWAPEVGVTETFSAEVTGHQPLLESTGVHNGLLVRPDTSGPVLYLHVSERGDVEVVAHLPQATVMVSADEQYALAGRCRSSNQCDFAVHALDGGGRRPLRVPASAAGWIHEGWGHFVAETDDLVIVQSNPDIVSLPPVLARCSLAQARCVRIEE
ncbi:MAG TPA: hypothetical protein VNT31_07405 [Nocardioides sp.]|nr:hypothetical protein [Nocardioides sp.]